MSSSIDINILSNDYYQYIELGNNIFRNFNFTVRHQTGELVRLPPLFPILVHLVAIFNKDPILAMRWLNTVALCLSIIPLFLFVSSSFNKYVGLFSSILFLFLAGIAHTLYHISSHSFFVLPLVTVCWLTWKVARNNSSKTLIMLDGFLISLATLTQNYAAFYLAAAIFFIIYFDLKAGVFETRYTIKKTCYLMLGFLPLFIFYAIAASDTAGDKVVYNNAVRAFLSGNYKAGKIPRDWIFYKLNKGGTEFQLLEEMKNTSIIPYCAAHPRFIIGKYKKGFVEMLDILKSSSNPFVKFCHPFFYIAISAILACAGIAGVLRPRHNRGGFYLIVWLFPLFFMPIILVKHDYVIPFLPFCATLIVAGCYNSYSLLMRKGSAKIFFLLVFFLFIFGFAKRDIEFYKRDPFIKRYEKAGLWIRGDTGSVKRRITVMARKTIFSYFADAEFLAIPYENGWKRVERFARLKGVDYIVLDSRYYRGLLKESAAPDKIEPVYRDISSRRNKITIYKLL